MRKCPVCSLPMAQERRQGLAIEVCAAHGMWLDHTELLLITEAERYQHGTFEWADIFRRPITLPADRERRLACPVCHEILQLDLYADVTIDWCREHGVWLDNGELDAILNNLRLDPMYLRGLALRISDARF